MAKIISLSDEIYARLEALAKPFEDREPEDVIRRLLDSVSNRDVVKPSAKRTTSEFALLRTPRERGTVVELDGVRISASTVPDLCTKVMQFIDSKGVWEKFVSLAPYSTSAKRYLFAQSPKHPRGNGFVAPLQYRNIYMETHKNYVTTINQLSRLLSQLGIDFKYVQ